MSKTTKTIATAGAALALVVGAGACDDDAEAATSKPEFIAQSNEICASNGEKANAIFEEVFGARTPENAQRFLERLVPVFANGVEERAAIPAPAGDEAAVDEINAAGDDALAGFEEAVTTPAASADLMLGKTPDPALEYDRLSEEYGIDGCAGDE